MLYKINYSALASLSVLAAQWACPPALVSLSGLTAQTGLGLGFGFGLCLDLGLPLLKQSNRTDMKEYIQAKIALE